MLRLGIKAWRQAGMLEFEGEWYALAGKADAYCKVDVAGRQNRRVSWPLDQSGCRAPECSSLRTCISSIWRRDVLTVLFCSH